MGRHVLRRDAPFVSHLLAPSGRLPNVSTFSCRGTDPIDVIHHTSGSGQDACGAEASSLDPNAGMLLVGALSMDQQGHKPSNAPSIELSPAPNVSISVVKIPRFSSKGRCKDTSLYGVGYSSVGSALNFIRC